MSVPKICDKFPNDFVSIFVIDSLPIANFAVMLLILCVFSILAVGMFLFSLFNFVIVWLFIHTSICCHIVQHISLS